MLLSHLPSKTSLPSQAFYQLCNYHHVNLDAADRPRLRRVVSGPVTTQDGHEADEGFRSGYLGVEVVLSFLAAGYRVRGTVRTQAQADAFLAKFPEHASNIEFTLVPSITEKGAFDEAVKGVDFIAHTASPVPSGVITVATFRLLQSRLNLTSLMHRMLRLSYYFPL